MRQALIAMMVYAAIFGALTIVSLYSYQHSVALFDIGLSARKIDLIVMVLSFAGLLKSLWHIIRIEL